MSTRTGLAILLSFCGVAHAGPPVDRVVVYGDRAQVTRKAEVTCTGGTARVAFFPLPLALDERTVRAEATGKAEAVGTTLSTEPLEADRDERAKAARDALEAAQAELRRLEAALARVRTRRGQVDRYEPYLQQAMGEGVRNLKPDLVGWTQALDRLRQGRIEANAQSLDLEVKLRKAHRDVERLGARAALLDPQNEKRGRRVEVAVDCKGDATTTVRLAYVVPGATWQPEYDLRFTPAGSGKTGPGQAELVVSAVVTQSTGEDWTEAQLVLSSARPWLGVQAPEPAPIQVYTVKVGEEKVLVQAQEKREEMKAGAGAMTRAPAEANVSDAGTAVTLTLPRRVTVRADGRPYWMPVDSVTGKAEARLVAVPAHTPFVYQVIKLDNPAGYPLLAGRLHTYRRGTYVGDTQLEHAGPGAPLEVSLGVDSELRVERGPRKERNKRPGMLSDTRHLERVYEVVVKNGGVDAEVEVREQIPVSKNAALKVEIVTAETTPGFGHDTVRGLLTWPVKIAQGRETKVNLAYTVHLPEDWKIQR